MEYLLYFAAQRVPVAAQRVPVAAQRVPVRLDDRNSCLLIGFALGFYRTWEAGFVMNQARFANSSAHLQRSWHQSSAWRLNMRAPLSKQFKNTVKNVLANVERKSGVSPDNPDFVALKRLLKSRVREVESSKNGERPLVRDWTTGRMHRKRTA
jgi:hypothetical protein